MSDKSTAMKKMRQQMKTQRTIKNVGNKIKASKLGQKMEKVRKKQEKLGSKISTMKDPAKRGKALARLERVNKRVTKRNKKADDRFTKKLAAKGITRPTPKLKPVGKAKLVK